LSRSAFWSLTPREIKDEFDSAYRRHIQHHNEHAWLAYHTAALHRVKRMPKLQTLLAKQPRRKQTWQEQLHIMRMWEAVTKLKEIPNG
jgi:hypothetical protein